MIHGFSKQGAKRVVNATRRVESNDDLYQRGRTRRPNGTRASAFVIGRVTEVDGDDPLLLKVREQFWSDGDTDYIDLPNGRTWDDEDGNLPKVRAIDGQVRKIDDIIAIGMTRGADNTRVWYALPEQRGWFYGKITTSAGGADHTVTEVDANGDILAGGRAPTDAEAMNGRRGVPVDTYCIVYDLGPTAADGDPVYKFTPWDGLTTTPKDLTATGASADSSDFDIEVDSEPVQYTAARVYDDTASSGEFYFFNRTITTDASGMIVDVTGETRSTLPGNGYYETRANNVLVDQIPNNGVLDFDDQQTPGTDELVVEWTLTGAQDADAGAGGNDQLRTVIQGKVDVSGLGGSGSGDGEVWCKLFTFSSTASGTYVLDTDDWTGRSYKAHIAYTTNGRTTAEWAQDDTISEDSSDGKIGTGITTDHTIFSTGLGNVVVDSSDQQLKIKSTSGPSSNLDYMQLTIVRTDRKTAVDSAFT